MGIIMIIIKLIIRRKKIDQGKELEKCNNILFCFYCIKYNKNRLNGTSENKNNFTNKENRHSNERSNKKAKTSHISETHTSNKYNNTNTNNNKNKNNNNNNTNEEENMHPSWIAKKMSKQKQNQTTFTGKKIVFNMEDE